MNQPTISELQAAVIKHTKDPLAAIKLQQAADKLDSLGKMLGSLVKKSDVVAYTDQITNLWPGDEIEMIAGDPAFLITLAALLRESIVRFIHEMHDKENVQ